MTQEQISTYRAALKEARTSFDKAIKRLAEIGQESYFLNKDVTRLRRTITALAAMCSEDPTTDGLGITEAVTECMGSEYGTVTTTDVVRGVEAMGFDLASQKNASASVHAILSRLAKKGAITKITDVATDSVTWRGPNYDPKWDDDIPF